MELRVWVDGTQRVVCGVKLTTTCHEIVFALAHATQQAGRFTMIERWRNNERLLSPNEQPLVTLQRWGDRMNEVEFILRKTSSDPPSTSHTQANHLHPQVQHESPNAPRTTSTLNDSSRSNNDSKPTPQQQIITNTNQGTPTNSITPSSSQLVNDQTYNNMYQQRPYSLNATRRPQTNLGPLTSSNSSLSLGPNYIQNSYHALNRLSGSFRPSLSTSTLPNPTNSIATSPSVRQPIMRPRFTDDQMMAVSSPSLSNNFQNGYSVQSESQYQQQQKITSHASIDQGPQNHPFEDLYSTINKRRNNQPPPVVPAKPRVISSLGNMQPITQNIYNAQMNYYNPNQSPASLCQSTMRPRHPPGYLDYMEAIASKNSINQSIIPNSNHINQSQNVLHSNMFPRSYDSHHAYSYRQSSVSPQNSSTNSNKYFYQANGQTNMFNHAQHHDVSPILQNFNNPINSKLMDSGLVINRGSTVNIKLPSNIQNQTSLNRASDERNNISANSNASSVSQIGHDMLKVIEEQKKVLMNQKNELDKLDNDIEYWEAKQNSDQTELINRIENEIFQLEELWKDNQTQIKKLENQDFEEVLANLKAEQVKMELEIQKQQNKLIQSENDISQCKIKIEQLETELAIQGYRDSPSDDEKIDERNSSHADIAKQQSNDDAKESMQQSYSNGTTPRVVSDIQVDDVHEKDDEDESSSDYSDDLNSDSLNARMRSAKDVAYVDKRGLISGIRSLKLDKTRSINRQMDANQLQQSIQPQEESVSPVIHSAHVIDSGLNNNNTLDAKSSETSGHYRENTANKYEFLMTL